MSRRTFATRAQLADAAQRLATRMSEDEIIPELPDAMDAAHLAGIELVGRWHLDRIIRQAHVLEAERICAELRQTLAV